MTPKKILLVLPAAGGSRAVGETLASVLARLGHPHAVFDCGKYEKGLRGLLRADAGVAEDVLNQTLIVKAIEEEAEVVLVMALCPVTVYTLRVLKKAGKMTAHYFAEDLSTGRLWEPVAPEYDHFFVIQKGKWIETIKSRYNPNTHYLPHGASAVAGPAPTAAQGPGLAFGRDVPREFPAAFAGAPYPNRIAFFEELCRLGLQFSIWGEGWDQAALSPALRRRVAEGGRWLPAPEIASIYGRASIVINLHSTLSGVPVDLNGDFANPRLFEVPLTGALQLVDRRAAVAEFFEEGREVVTFSSAAEACEKARFYLARPEEARRITQNALEKTVQHHLWEHRLTGLFEAFGWKAKPAGAISVAQTISMAQEKMAKGQPLDRVERLYLLAGEIISKTSREEEGYA